jgi:hypothetical protein
MNYVTIKGFDPASRCPVSVPVPLECVTILMFSPPAYSLLQQIPLWTMRSSRSRCS